MGRRTVLDEAKDPETKQERLQVIYQTEVAEKIRSVFREDAYEKEARRRNIALALAKNPQSTWSILLGLLKIDEVNIPTFFNSLQKTAVNNDSFGLLLLENPDRLTNHLASLRKPILKHAKLPVIMALLAGDKTNFTQAPELFLQNENFLQSTVEELKSFVQWYVNLLEDRRNSGLLYPLHLATLTRIVLQTENTESWDKPNNPRTPYLKNALLEFVFARLVERSTFVSLYTEKSIEGLLTLHAKTPRSF